MSASSKKKLRKEQESAKLTEQQLAAQKEAKKLNLYTIIFIVTLALILVVALVVGIAQSIANSGIRERKTVALTIGDHELSNAEFGYFYMDAVNQFSSQYGSYAMLLGLDTSKPLDEQVLDEETGRTWADDFLDTAKENAKAVYALTDAAEAEGFTLTQEQEQGLQQSLANVELYAQLYGYSDTERYLKALYGKGATLESFQEYNRLSLLASSYYMNHSESLQYSDADLRAVDKENFDNYSSYTYSTYYLSTSSFLTGGTTDEEGNTTYSDQEKAAAAKAAQEAADSLAALVTATAEELQAAVAALEVNKDKEIAPTEYKDQLHTSLNSLYADWVADSARKDGDVACFASTTTDEEGKETVNGYYILRYSGSTTNEFPLANVRHILIAFQGGTSDETTGTIVYSDEEKAAAKKTAEETLAAWKNGDANEESFAALANESSADGDGTTGGLYENVYPGQMVASFNDWCFAPGRKAGDTGIVESQYGYHVMYYAGDSNLTYRDYMIENELRAADLDAWNQELVSSVTATDGNMKYLMTDLVLAPQQ